MILKKIHPFYMHQRSSRGGGISYDASLIIPSLIMGIKFINNFCIHPVDVLVAIRRYICQPL